jgi:hypothetical protein
MIHNRVILAFVFAKQWRRNELLKVHAWCGGNGGMWVGPPEYRWIAGKSIKNYF